MWLIVGLGNPGAEYEGTRHNVGFEVVRRLAKRASVRLSERKFKGRLARGALGGEEVTLLMPETYMNLSGESVGPCMGHHRLTTEALLVVHDDMDLDLGRIKLKKGGGHGGHNGLRSLARHLPDPDYVRVRVGVGRPPPEWDPAEWVLSRFTEGPEVERVVAKAADAVEVIVRDGLSKAMNTYNRSSEKSESGGGKEALETSKESDERAE